ncbi:non-ribosomal peptide synthetase component F [Streptosporangium album]|uniref:Non-ribosomal peptide synthetase component F n=1 Tax=Streptosporangium album TaxID=47479 RepID=A0A7W7RX98_9ACTN|nr:AMP-binding protein [Streptosporangium album]MBB4939951.1 non-ribosomal peptide synthetase component F [Streptosporangium album]
MRGFYEIAAADPARVAVAADTTTTYGELHDRVNQVSHGLVARGVRPGDTVVTVLPNGTDAVTMMLATYQIGAYHVPVNWHYTSEEIGYIVADCAARVVGGPERHAGAVPDGSPGGGDSGSSPWSSRPPAPSPVPASPPTCWPTACPGWRASSTPV